MIGHRCWFTLAVLEQRLDIVIVQPRFVPHVSGFDFERTAARFVFDTQQRRSQEIIQGIPERRSLDRLSPFNRATTSSSSVTVVRMLMMYIILHHEHHYYEVLRGATARITL